MRTGILAGSTVLSVAGGAAVAVSDDPVPQIHACVSRGLLGLGKGTIRVVSAPSACTSGEDALT
jgi:hypothetical protein